jgi:hypothetical protein
MPNSPVRRTKYNTVEVEKVHNNVGQEIIEITEDRLRLILNAHLEVMISRSAWQAPLTMFLTILIVICTAEFKVAWGLSKDTWNAIFVILLFLSILWLGCTLIKMKKSQYVEDILKVAKNEKI